MAFYPSVTILVPTYNNRAGTLTATLESITAQTLIPADLQVLVSNDGSTDSTDSVVSAFQSRLPSVRAFNHKNRLGGPGNWDFLLSQASSDFVFLLCDDDCIAPTFLASYLAVLRDFPDVDMIFSDIDLMGPDFSFLARQNLATPPGESEGEARVRHQLRSKHMVMSTMYRRSLLTAAGKWDAQVGSHLDCTAFCRAALRARRTYRIESPLLQFRISAGSWSHRLNTQNQGQLAAWYRRKLDLLMEDAEKLAPFLKPYLIEMYPWHASCMLAHLELEFAKKRLGADQLRAALLQVINVFPEIRFARMPIKVLLLSLFGTGWISKFRKVAGRPDPYLSSLALFNSFNDPPSHVKARSVIGTEP